MSNFSIWTTGIIGGVIVLLLLVILLGFLFGILKLFRVEEGTGTAFKYLGKYCGSKMSLSEFHFRSDEAIEPGDGVSSTIRCWCIWEFGGYVIYIKGLVEPTTYEEQNAPDGFGGGYSVFLNQIQRDIDLQKAETKKGEEIPLNIKAAFKMKVVNIRKFLYISPKDVIARVIENMQSIMRGWIKGNSYDTIQAVKSNGKRLWDQFGPAHPTFDNPLSDIQVSIKEMERDWGVEILEGSIFIIDVGLLQEDQDAFAATKRERLKAAARAQEVFGGMLQNEALSMGFEDDKTESAQSKALKELQKTDEGRERLAEMVAQANQVVTQRARGAKLNLFGNADGSPLEPATATLASLLSLLGGGGASTQSSPVTGDSSGGGQNPGGAGGSGESGSGGKKRKRAPWNKDLEKPKQ